ncbi:hypothetical protein H5410_009829 [Solanum commersonii]|uniref:Uncharacterized protein n=1 Tax=Solanum commersonii TaxID=4109 RepID=A0A9J6AJW4_SOLCO|nr:hypothetical protein H5410_009829 [Solanum commersonii]
MYLLASTIITECLCVQLLFEIEHTSLLKDKVCSQRLTTVGLISGIVAPKYVNHQRKHTPKDIQEDVKPELGVDINYIKAWRSKERAI